MAQKKIREPFFSQNEKYQNIRCSVETLKTNEKQFFRKNYTSTENCEFSNNNFANFLRFCDSNFLKF